MVVVNIVSFCLPSVSTCVYVCECPGVLIVKLCFLDSVYIACMIGTVHEQACQLLSQANNTFY